MEIFYLLPVGALTFLLVVLFVGFSLFRMAFGLLVYCFSFFYLVFLMDQCTSKFPTLNNYLMSKKSCFKQ